MTIAQDTEITLINVFSVTPEKQQSAADKVAEIYTTIVSQQPGFIAAKIHKSLDGTRVTAVARWESEAALDAMQHTSDFQKSIPQLKEDILGAEPHTYQVICSLGETHP